MLIVRLFALTSLVLVSYSAAIAEQATESTTSNFEKTFSLSSLPTVTINNIEGVIELAEGPSNTVQLFASGEDSEKSITTEQKDNFVTISGSSNNSSNNLSVNSSSGTVNIQTSSGGSQKIIINGKEFTKQDTKEPLHLKILLPKGSATQLSTTGSLVASVDLGHTILLTKGTSSTKLAKVKHLELVSSGRGVVSLKSADSIQAKMSGVSELTLSAAKDTDLNASLDGSSRLSARGTFKTISIKTNGVSKASTSGVVNENFTADSSGASKITHSGAILGETKQTQDGVSRINILK